MTTEPRTLDLHELRYLSSVRDALTGVTRSTRRHLVDTLEENLRDRPLTADADELTRALGTPAEYADRLLEEADAAEPGAVARSRRRHRINVAAINAAVIAVVAAVVLTYRWWDTWQADMGQQSWRICAGDGSADTCDQSLFTDNSNTVRQAMTVSCVAGKTFTVAIGLSTDRPVEVTGIEIPGTDIGGGSLLRLDSVTVHQRLPPDGVLSPTPVPLPVVVGDTSAPYDGDYDFRLHYTLVCDRANHMASGTTYTFDDFRVHYHALGKDRIHDVPLMYAIQIRIPDHL